MKISKAFKYLLIILVAFVLLSMILSYLITTFLTGLGSAIGNLPVVGEVFDWWAAVTNAWNDWLTTNLGIVDPAASSVADWISTWWDQSMQWWSTTIANAESMEQIGSQDPLGVLAEGLNAIAIWWNSLWNP